MLSLAAQQKEYGDILDFSANINPLGPPEWLRPLISLELEKIEHYPDPGYTEMVDALARSYGVERDCIVPANGSSDLLYLLPRILGCQRAVVPVPSYIDYVRAAELGGLEVETLPLREDQNFQLDPIALANILTARDLVILGSPNNPTGSLVEKKILLDLAASHPQVTFLVDEAFLDFVDDADTAGGIVTNILTLNSMTKFYGVPGLRLGFGMFPADTAAAIKKHLPPWTLNSLAQAFAIAAVADREYQVKSRVIGKQLRQDVISELAAFSELKVYPSAANYLLIRINTKRKASELAVKLLEKNILIRCCDNYIGLDDSYFRIAVRNEKDNSRLLSALATVYARQPGPVRLRQRKRTPAIMFQGTSSNAGKSVLTAAMCRILLQDGVRVAPFKAQNMSLNSFVTRHGEEMGRAQVVQAQAARLDPEVQMNPVLLKPNSDTGSQIIVHGKPVGNMSVADYSDYKPQAWKHVCESYDHLANEYQAIILEGAGSPGEVNLKSEDIVNMPMARYAESPVLLVGDIDRGGVYASFVGTMEVLANWERALVAGFVVNRFRGQQSLLASAHDYLLKHTGKEVFGVVPYISDLGLPEEDSVSFKEGLFNTIAKHEQSIDIVLVNFPHISNFTDVEPFLAEPDVRLRVVDKAEDLGHPDAIILPGSKNVIGDLKFLVAKGFAPGLKQRAEADCEIVGICGGYQLLGRTIKDPLGIESSEKEVDALGLIDLKTEMQAEKCLTRQQGVHLSSGLTVAGYEIHHGVSASQAPPVLQFADGKHCGSIAANQPVWGTYLHGIFDSDVFRRWFIDNLREKKGLKRLQTIQAPYNLEEAFDRLAETVRKSLDMDAIYRLLKL